MSSRLVYGRSDEISAWVAVRIEGCARGFGECQAIGIDRGGLIAGFVYHNWSPEHGTIEISAAAVSPRWATRRNIAAVLAYPFDGLQCRLVTARHSERNAAARRLWRGLGATEHFIPDLRADGEAETIAVLTAKAWQTSRLNNGQTQSS